jgi:hypothetical protein
VNPSFEIDVRENFDLTISNQSHYFEKALKHKKIVEKHAMHQPEMATTLMKQFPLEDQGLVLIFGPLPSGATSYPVHEVFEGKNFPNPDAQNGYGLIFKVEEPKVVVQFGNRVLRLEYAELRKSYKMQATGLPSPPENSDEGL